MSSAQRSRVLWEQAFLPTETRRARYGSAFKAIGAFTAAALTILAAGGLFAATRAAAAVGIAPRFLNWHMALATAVYFPWALLQQYIFQHYLLGRLLRVAPIAAAVAITALAFACVHFPRWPVMALTTIAGSVWALAFYRYRLLLPLAMSHALLGSALHYWVFGQDLLDTWLP